MLILLNNIFVEIDHSVKAAKKKQEVVLELKAIEQKKELKNGSYVTKVWEGLGIEVSGARFPKKPEGTTLVSRDTSLVSTHCRRQHPRVWYRPSRLTARPNHQTNPPSGVPHQKLAKAKCIYNTRCVKQPLLGVVPNLGYLPIVGHYFDESEKSG
ncbi:hypothetical protein PHYBLDRAFT_70039 [Phycomyces blakesleeanus NRRL 1555(-)]|uniref:Uncharacterized protein n=1 Tax=Phycomyces blakesleeanus (strain ATCC 8743b / DSM 1359 / FGSC 10004 / NBRC 33097 / NRRL 1555) TaxID=763407 RepID=A0A162N6I0_PHYB8|nr:hypothetical protein PHYBLDRAFT_70039 [Phycomyces blakesleeanus NRRL 1555(-)]OAD71628.1 hypothetical protein PHYBLDRAFT_70039 [Phycomyces blakesleeanus NRRL 1555(-)]|eukprot:XP_018289668.1 hypothetical protein PHYBLDRAFT_70039 [Phycomyces blakesleeanus NRRL 1555(-)]